MPLQPLTIVIKDPDLSIGHKAAVLHNDREGNGFSDFQDQVIEYVNVNALGLIVSREDECRGGRGVINEGCGYICNYKFPVK